MMIKNIAYVLMVIMLVLTYSCTPKVDDFPDIGEAPAAVNISVTNLGPNDVEFSAPSGYFYFWDFGTTSSNSQSVAVSYPFKGDYEVILTVAGIGGSTQVTTTVTIPANDPAIGEQPYIKELTDSGAGRTWVYYTDSSDGYFYMTANYDWEEFWWQPADDGDLPPGLSSELTFDLDGGYNYTLAPDGSTLGVQKSFSYDADKMTITFTDSNLPDVDDGNLNSDRSDKNIYQVKILDDGELLLWQDQQNDDYAWAWRFKPKN